MSESHWTQHAKQWQLLDSPLRPHADDIAIYQGLLNQHVATKTRLVVVVLGVTPEIVKLQWPDGTHLHAIERVAEMAQSCWQDQPDRRLHLADWLQMPLPNDSVDLVIGDGCFTNLASEHQYLALYAEIGRVLKLGGHFIHRYFTQSPIKENPVAVLATPDDNFHAYKWRLAMSLQPDFASGVKLADIWQRHQQCAAAGK